MKIHYTVTRVAVGLALAIGAPLLYAADKAGGPDPANPTQQVPPTVYRSAITYLPAAGSTQSPAQNWKALNLEVGSYDSMSLTMGDMPGSEGMMPHGEDDRPPANMPKSGDSSRGLEKQKDAAQPDPHAQHRKPKETK